MKWRSEETLAAYQHYFNEQLDADTRADFHQRMHKEVELYLEERQRGKRGKLALNTENISPRPDLSFDDEPDLAFLYNLAGRS